MISSAASKERPKVRNSGPGTPPSPLEFRLFGGFEVRIDSVPARFGAPPRAVPILAHLLLMRGTPVSRASLATAFWPDEPDDTARSNLRRHLHAIVNALPRCDDAPWLDTTRSTVAWNMAAAAAVDVWTFNECADDPARYGEAMALCRGEFLPDYYDEWVLSERERLRSTYLNVCYESALLARRERDFDAALDRLARILAWDEWREDVVRLIMSIRYEAGDRAGALATFEQFAGRLRAEMRVEPMSETIAVRDAVLSSSLSFQSDGDQAAPASSQGSGQPFVGRVAELETLTAAWQRAGRGFGSALFIGGIAGVGKSSLIAELSALVESQGGRVLLGLTSAPEAFPYESLVTALRRGLALLLEARIDRVWLAALSAILPELHGARPEIGEPESLSADASRTRLIEAIVRSISALARVRPLMLVLEDIHWAESSTLSIIESLNRRIGALPVFLVATYRAEETGASHPISVLRRKLQSEHQAQSLMLPALREPEVEQLVARMPGFEQAEPSLAKTIYQLSEGNSLFAMQLLRSYEETGVLPDLASAAKSIGEAIRGRIEILEEPSRTLVEAAAVIGQSFTVEFVARVLGWNENEVVGVFGSLLDRSIIRETGARDVSYAFTHALIAASVYDAIPAPQRIARHRRIAQLLEQLQPQESAVARHRQMLATIARHWELAGDLMTARDAYIRAARAALDVYARNEAAALARSACNLGTSDRERYEALSIAVSALDDGGDILTHKRNLDELERLGAAVGPLELFDALEFRCRLLVREAENPTLRGVLKQMQACLDQAPEDSRDVEMMSASASGLMLEGYLEDALQQFLTIVELPPSRVDRSVALEALGRVIQITARRGEVAAARRAIEEYRVRSPRGADRLADLKLAFGEGMIAFVTEDRDELLRVGTEIIALSQAVGDTGEEAYGHSLLAYVEIIDGNIDGARASYDVGIELFERCGRRQNQIANLVNKGVVEREVGHCGRAIAIWEKVRDMARPLKLYSSLTVCAVNIAEAHFASGNLAAALESAREAYELCFREGEGRVIADALVALGASECANGITEIGLAHLREGITLRRTLSQERSLNNDLALLIDALVQASALPEALPLAKELAQNFQADPDQAMNPAWICKSLGRYERACGNELEADRWEHRRREQIDKRIAKFNDEDRAAYIALYG